MSRNIAKTIQVEQVSKKSNKNSLLTKEIIKILAVSVIAIISLFAVYSLSNFNYLFFHSVVEFFGISITFTIFAIAWNSRKIMNNHYLLFISIAFLFVGSLSLLHILTYQGINIFPEIDANWTTQLWIATRYLLSLTMLTALLFLRRKFNPMFVFAIFSVIFSLILASIFYLQIFPTAYVDGVGLTNFKIVSEFIVSGISLLTAGLIIKKRKEFSGNIVKYLVAALITIVICEMSFTLYVDVYGFFNMFGHLLNVVAFYLIYKAFIETGLSKPYELLFHDLKKSEMILAKRASELTETNRRLENEITERKKAQETLRENAVLLEKYSNQMEKLAEQRLEKLKESERLATIGATAGMVGHDIRNPLQAITGDLYLAKMETNSLPESEEKKKIMESLVESEKSLDYINKIVQDLQDYSRPLNPKFEQCELEEILERLISKNEIPKNIKVSIKIDAQTKKIHTDAYYLNRILYNLVTNAVQAMPKGGKLSIKAFTKTNNTVIAIQDNGSGIPQEVRGKMFTVMFTTKAKGQGFGLPVVKRMTESLGGTVSFESQEGKGTTFTLQLPTSLNTQEVRTK